MLVCMHKVDEAVTTAKYIMKAVTTAKYIMSKR